MKADVYELWATQSEEFWKERCRKALDDEYTNLIRVARAAKENIRVHKVVDGTTIGTVFDMKFATRELEKALKEVEHLL